MRSSKAGWTDFLRRQGSAYLAWVETNCVLKTKFETLSVALWKLLQDVIRTPNDARDVLKSIPAVLAHCNEQATYAMKGAATAYAWLHLLDRYVRTWIALERLVAVCKLPLAKYGVRALDVGTGPGPSAFAVNDFYTSMTEFAAQTGNLQWQQKPTVTCVEFDSNTNHLRHCLAEIVYELSVPKTGSVLDMCSAISDFRVIDPRAEREYLQETLQMEEDEDFDEVAKEWTSNLRYSAADANDKAQSIHRYRLIIFSNFLTTVGVVTTFEPNLIKILNDAQPGSVVMVLGGKKAPYPDIYNFVDRLAKPAGFELEIERENVSSARTVVSNQIYEERVKVYEYLLNLTFGEAVEDHETQKEQFDFINSLQSTGVSQLRAYRKPR
jgi:hypothetical protein